MRLLAFSLLMLLLPVTAYAVDATAGQEKIDASKVLRGRFIENHASPSAANGSGIAGHFVAAPSNGLIWTIEKPLPTSTIVTPQGMVQDIGGIVVKLPVKNLRHLYDIVSGALSGNWHALEDDFILTQSGSKGHWQMLLTPRNREAPVVPYSSITVSGGRFVENIVMTRVDNGYDSLSFSDEALTAAPPTATESAIFRKVIP